MDQVDVGELHGPVHSLSLIHICLLHTFCGIPAILAGILTQLGLWSVNMAIMGMKATVAINVTTPEMLDKLLVSLRFVQDVAKGSRCV